MKNTLIRLMALALVFPVAIYAKHKHDADKHHKRHHGKPIIVKRNQPVVSLELPANPSTGYRWILTRFDAQRIIPVNAKFLAPEKGKPGQGGVTVWQFRLKPQAFVVPQVIRIKLVYARPTELKPAKEKTFSLVTE